MAVDLEHPYFHLLPENLLEEILSRLPVKTLVRFRCVSKQWKSLISNSLFKSLHHKNTIKNPPSLLMLNKIDPTSPSPRVHVLTTLNLAGEVIDQWNLPITGDSIELLPSPSEYNKLVCFTDRKRFFVCNPSIKLCIELPDSYPLIVYDSVKDPLKYPSGFAYLPSRDEYVIVQLTPFKMCGILTLSISKEDKLIYKDWKIVKGKFYYSWKLDPWGAFVNGVFYWLTIMPGEHLMSFDVDKEKFKTFDWPSVFGNNGATVSILELKGNVYLRYRQPKLSTIQLWKLEHDLTWSKKYNISTPDFDWGHGSILSPIFMNEAGEILFIQNGEYLKYYNPDKRICTKVSSGKGKVGGSRPRWENWILHTDNMFLLGN